MVQLVLVSVADLAGLAGLADPVDGAVEILQQFWNPGALSLGNDELQPRKPLEHAAQHEVDERALRVKPGLVDVEEHRKRVVAVVRCPGASVNVDRHLKVLEDFPQSVIGRVVERPHPLDVRRDVGQKDSSAEAVFLDPVDVVDGVVDVIEEDLADARPALGKLAAEINQPAVVGPDPGEAMLVVFGLGGRSEENKTGKERRDRVRKDHLSDDAIGLLLAIAHLSVPVAEPPRVTEIPERVLVFGPPGVEFLQVLGIEILAIGGVAAAGMAVSRDDRVVTVGPVNGHIASLHSRSQSFILSLLENRKSLSMWLQSQFGQPAVREGFDPFVHAHHETRRTGGKACRRLQRSVLEAIST